MNKKGHNDPFSSNNNLWLSVKRDIEAKIITGEYSVGKKIPTIVELVEQYAIGKTTAQKIINALDSEGTIIKKVGIGCFVKPYVKERLFAQHEQELERQIQFAVAEALLLGFDEDFVTTLFRKIWKEELRKK